MIQHDESPAATDEAGARDAAIVDEAALEDETTQIVPQAQLTPPPPTPGAPPLVKPLRGGSLHAAGAPVASASPNQVNQPNQANAPLPPNPPYQASQPQQPQPGAGQGQRQQGTPRVVPVVSQMRDQRPPMPGQAIHAPWHTASSWGATTFVITAETAAGFSYLFWWVSGLLVYFNERENRYVRFHAVQSILLTGALSVFSVIAFTVAAILNDVFVSTQQHIWQTLCIGVIALSLLIVLLPWLTAMIAAWTGTYLQLPIIGDYAERFAAPPIQLRP
jgi:uncharacterized membrane protein